MSAQPGLLQEILDRIRELPPEQRQELERDTRDATRSLKKWVPNPGPQTEAYYSEADVLLYGGEPGGGKTQLIIGWALNCSESALIMRRQYTDLDAITDEAIKINGTRDGFNGKAPPVLRHAGGRIDFGAAARPGDEQSWMGRPHDFFAPDEATQFTKKQIRFLRGWVRTTTAGQRCRTILPTNPPLTADGAWVVEMFAPWLDPKYPYPARQGELRWVVTDEEDNDIWVDGPGTYEIAGGKRREAESRTYIHAALQDNPQLAGTDYQKRLDSMPAEIRRILLGGFQESFRDDQFQVIPTEWVRAAMQRWRPQPPPRIPMVAIACDPAAGGQAKSTLAWRHDWWYGELLAVPGVKTPLGRDVAGLIVANRRDNALVVIDMGGGYGGAVYECLIDNIEEREIVRYLGSESSVQRSVDGKLAFVNKRAEAHWRFREALDPSQPNGSPLALPDDPELLADLTAPTFQMTPAGIKVLPKSSPTGDSVMARLGRSPDRGDAVVMAWSAGDRLIPMGRPYRARRGFIPKVNLGPRRKQR